MSKRVIYVCKRNLGSPCCAPTSVPHCKRMRFHMSTSVRAPLLLAVMPPLVCAQPATFDGTVRPFLVKTCYTCHNAKQTRAGLNLESLTFRRTIRDTGSNNIGDALSLSPVLMEKNLAAADKVVQTAIFGQENLKPTVERHQRRE